MSLATHPPIDSLTIHPALDVWPVSEGMARQLVSSIKNHGFDQTFPILVWRDQIVDGRLRLDALKALEITPQWGIHLKALDADMGESDVWMTCGRANGTRRHLTKSQRATIAVPYLPHYEAAARARMLAGKASDGGAKGEAAELLGDQWEVSATMIRLARRLSQEAPELFERARLGKTTVSAATKQLDIEQGKREPDNPRFNVRYDSAHQPMVEELIAYYKAQGTSLNKRLLELLTQDHARMQAGVWQQSEQQRRVAGVLRELDPALNAQLNPEQAPDTVQQSVETPVIIDISDPSAPSRKMVEGGSQPSRKMAEGHPDNAAEADAEYNPFTSDEEAPQPSESQGRGDGTTIGQHKLTEAQAQRLIDRFNVAAGEWNRIRGPLYVAHRQAMLNDNMGLGEIVKHLLPKFAESSKVWICSQIRERSNQNLLTLHEGKPGEVLFNALATAWAKTPDEEAWFKALDSIPHLPGGVILNGKLFSMKDLFRKPSTGGTKPLIWRLEGYRTWNPLQEPVPSSTPSPSPDPTPTATLARAPAQAATPRAERTTDITLSKGELASHTARSAQSHVQAPERMSVRLDSNAPDALPFNAIMSGIAERTGRSLDRPASPSTHSAHSTHSTQQSPRPERLTLPQNGGGFEGSSPPQAKPGPQTLEEALAQIPHPDQLQSWENEDLYKISTHIVSLSNNGCIISDREAQHAYDLWRKGMREHDPQSSLPSAIALDLAIRLKRRLGCTRDENHAGLHAALKLAGQKGVTITQILVTQVHTEAWIKLAANLV